MVMIGGSELLREYRVHVLEIPSDLEDQDGSSLALALIVLRRSEGLLIAVPDGVFSQEALAGGLDVTQDDQPLGQSIVVTVPGGTLPGFEGTEHPDPLEDAQVDVLLVDVSNVVAAGLTPFDARAHPMELLHTFNANIPQLVPVADHLVSAVWNWIQDPGSGQLVQFYSAEEEEVVPETPLGPARRPMRPKASPGVGGGGARPNVPAESKKPRPTVASLAASLDTVTQTLPMIVQQLEALALRTENVERHVGKDQSRPSALQEPLGSCATTGLLTASRTPAEMLKLMPPPKGTRTGAGAHPPAEVEQLAKEKLSEEDNPQVDLAKAVYAQSQALTSVVAQLAAGDPMTDLSSSSTSLSTKGAQGRAKLQQELAQHRGTFFTSVLQSMSRRMQPAQPSDLTPHAGAWSTWDHPHDLCGTFRRLWPTERLGMPTMAGRHDPGPLAKRELQCCKGCHCASGSLHRAKRAGQWSSGHRPSVGSGRRPPPQEFSRPDQRQTSPGAGLLPLLQTSGG